MYLDLKGVMKHNPFIIFFLSILVISCNNEEVLEDQLITYADGEFPEKIIIGPVRLQTQSQVDNFGAKNYTTIEGTLKIASGDLPSDNIIDLTPLRSIERVEGGLLIWDCWKLTSLEGLQNIKWIERLSIHENDELIDLDGLRGLQNIVYENPRLYNRDESSLYIIDNRSLENINGLRHVPSVKYISIFKNPLLENLDGLESLINNTTLRIGTNCNTEEGIQYYCGNDKLKDLCGLQNLLSFGKFNYVLIKGNAFNPSIDDIRNGNCYK